jgi:hypothetical protein
MVFSRSFHLGMCHVVLVVRVNASTSTGLGTRTIRNNFVIMIMHRLLLLYGNETKWGVQYLEQGNKHCQLIKIYQMQLLVY